jgi:hypothetical protein
MYYKTILTEDLEKFSHLLKDFIRSSSHETGMKSINREHFILVIIYIIDVYMRSQVISPAGPSRLTSDQHEFRPE